MQYRADIDGLRAVSVLAVLAFHATWLAGGFAGVDVFFTISGYLITGIIATEIAEGRYRVGHFYERRVRRLAPTLIAVLVATTLGASLLLLPNDLAAYGKSLIATNLFGSNIQFWRESGYFDTSAALKPLLHTWSLAVEEQFYIAYPLGLWICWKLFGKKWVIPLAIVGLASFAVGEWGALHNPSAAFYLPVTRAWELLLGCALALVQPKRPPQYASVILSALGIALIIGAFLLLNTHTPFPGAAALAPCVGCALLIYAPTPALGVKPLAYIGRLSYALYLWHWPILSLARYWSPAPLSTLETIAALSASFLLAAASYHWLEIPVRRRAILARRRTLVVTFAVASLTLIATGAAFLITGGWSQRFTPSVVALDAKQNDKAPLRCKTECLIGDRTRAPTILIWGDSQAWAISDTLDTALKRNGLAGELVSQDGCAPMFGLQRPLFTCDTRSRVKALIRAQPKVVVLISAWGPYYGMPKMSFGTALGARAVDAALENTLYFIHNEGAKTILFDPPPGAQDDVPRRSAQSQALGRVEPITWKLAHYIASNAPYFSEVARLSPLISARVSPWRHLCKTGTCQVSIDGRPIYIDSGHPTSHGFDFALPDIAAALPLEPAEPHPGARKPS
ncbi:MAG TPA: acyltransferase family protein [Caulobacteraceae bacterium]